MIVLPKVEPLDWEYDDGGRSAAGYKGKAPGDCVTRAIAIATGQPYRVVFDALAALAETERRSKRRRSRSDPRRGVHRVTYEAYLKALGWVFVPTMQIGSGVLVHLRIGEFPARGRYVVRLSRHLAAVVDGVIRDRTDPARNGTRCVYGYYYKPGE